MKTSLAVLLLAAAVATAQGQVNPVTHQKASYENWLREEVGYIITPEERAQYLKLTSDAERDQFVVQFWARRDPTPGTPENEYKEEHYRRIAYSNEHFAEKMPGWKTDRGHAYIVFGPPDEVLRARDRISETWVYRHTSVGGREQRMLFIDQCRCGEYRLQTR